MRRSDKIVHAALQKELNNKIEIPNYEKDESITSFFNRRDEYNQHKMKINLLYWILGY